MNGFFANKAIRVMELKVEILGKTQD